MLSRKNMDYQNLSAKKFKRRFGVHKQTFREMVEAVKSVEAKSYSPSKRGPKPKLSVEEQILVTLEYWREYRTYFHIGTSWKLSESTICRIVNRIEKMLLESGRFRLKGKKALLNRAKIPEVTVMDVTETPIERPQKKQKDFYSGKRGYHTLKSQLVADQNTAEIICVFCGKGRGHDFSLFKKSRICFHPLTTSIQDSGYQGIDQYHSNSYTPKKKPKKGELTSLEKEYNKALAKERIIIEHINRKLKIFKILSCKYRNRRRRYGLRCNLLAAIYNYELGITAS
jgi:hypothetical protein